MELYLCVRIIHEAQQARIGVVVVVLEAPAVILGRMCYQHIGCIDNGQAGNLLSNQLLQIHDYIGALCNINTLDLFLCQIENIFVVVAEDGVTRQGLTGCGIVTGVYGTQIVGIAALAAAVTHINIVVTILTGCGQR